MLNQMRANCINCFRARVDTSDDDDGSARRSSSSSSTVQQAVSSNTNEDDDDQYLWSTDLKDHFSGEYSIARTHVKPVHEVYGQVNAETPNTFVGVYDGHHGDLAAQFLFNNLFKYTKDRVTRSGGTISETVLFDAIERTEDIFLNSMKVICEQQPAGAINASSFATVGSSCLIGLISDKKLFVANLGDSRAVMCSIDASSHVHVEQLTPEDSLRINAVKEQILELHHDDAQDIVCNRLVKGKVVTTKSIGDLYLKEVEYSSIPEVHPRFRLNTPLRRPALSAEPYVSTIALDETKKFVIFASYGIWNFLTNEKAVEIVATKPRKGIARRLIREALTEAAIRGNPPCTYEFLMALNFSARMDDYQKLDMMVAVIYLDKDGLLSTERGTGQSSATTALDEGANVAALP